MAERFQFRSGLGYTAPELSRAYKTAFGTPEAKRFVLPDLAEFCYAYEMPPSASDLWVQARLIGRRDMWLHLRERVALREDEIETWLIARLPPPRQR
jgi:hypothetical protein